MIRILICSFALLYFAGASYAELEWDSTVYECNVDLDDLEITKKFEFVNTGTTSVLIKKVRTSCGCTTAGVNDESFAPGVAGVVTVHYILPNKVGYQTVWCRVVTDDEQTPVETLKLVVHIPQLVYPSCDSISWYKGREIIWKQFSFRVDGSKDVEKGQSA